MKVGRGGKTVFVVGDNANNCIEISGTQKASCDVEVSGIGDTTLDGESVQSGVNKIIVRMLRGDDRVDVAVDCPDSSWRLSLDDGIDRFNVDDDAVVKQIDIQMGPGDDTVSVNDISIRKRSVFRGGRGNDDLFIDEPIVGPLDLKEFEGIGFLL